MWYNVNEYVTLKYVLCFSDSQLEVVIDLILFAHDDRSSWLLHLLPLSRLAALIFRSVIFSVVADVPVPLICLMPFGAVQMSAMNFDDRRSTFLCLFSFKPFLQFELQRANRVACSLSYSFALCIVLVRPVPVARFSTSPCGIVFCVWRRNTRLLSRDGRVFRRRVV